MDLAEYQRLKARRKQIGKLIDDGDKSEKLMNEVKAISKKLKDDPPDLEMAFGAIGDDPEEILKDGKD